MLNKIYSKWEYCHGCDNMDSDKKPCEYEGKFWLCEYADAIEEDINREESEDF